MSRHRKTCPRHIDPRFSCECMWRAPDPLLTEEEEDAQIEYWHRVRALNNKMPHLLGALEKGGDQGKKYVIKTISSLGYYPSWLHDRAIEDQISWVLQKMSPVQEWLYSNNKERGLFGGDTKEAVEKIFLNSQAQKQKRRICLLLTHVGSFVHYKELANKLDWELIIVGSKSTPPNIQKVDLIVKMLLGTTHSLLDTFESHYSERFKNVPIIQTKKASLSSLRTVLQQAA